MIMESRRSAGRIRKAKLVEFWTPSADTQIDLAKAAANGQVSDADAWQKTTEERVDQFENELWSRFHGGIGGPLHGLRRYQEIGHGQTQRKRGWWWIVNVRRDFDSRELAKFYFDFWKNSRQMYGFEIKGKSADGCACRRLKGGGEAFALLHLGLTSRFRGGKTSYWVSPASTFWWYSSTASLHS
jgi:hypothetical protein